MPTQRRTQAASCFPTVAVGRLTCLGQLLWHAQLPGGSAEATALCFVPPALSPGGQCCLCCGVHIPGTCILHGLVDIVPSRHLCPFQSDNALRFCLCAVLCCAVQITYVQLGAAAVTGTWSSPSLKSDGIRVGALFRAEVSPLTQAVTAGQFSPQDLAAASQLLADVITQRQGAVVGDMEVEGGGDGAARVLMDQLLRRPFGEVLMCYAAATGSCWAAGETEYGM